MAVEFNIDWWKEGRKYITYLLLTNCYQLIGRECFFEEIAKIEFKFSEGVKDIADRCLNKAKEFVDNKLKAQEKETIGRVLAGDFR